MNMNDKASWLSVVWEALHDWEAEYEGRSAVGTETFDERWDNICTAMAWIHEELGVKHEEV